MEYEFVFVVEGVSVDDDDVVGIVFERFDGLLGCHRGRHLLSVAASGSGAVDAAQRLAVRLHRELPAMRLLRLDPELVAVPDIAERTGHSRQNVLQWVNGQRRAERPFPEPEGTAGRSPVWRWAEVHAWLAATGLGDGSPPSPLRAEALHIDSMLPNWQQNLDDGLPIVRVLTAGDDEHSAERTAVQRLLEGTLSVPGVLEAVSAFPRPERYRLAVVCAVPSDRLSAVVKRFGTEEACGVLAVQGERTELHLIPVSVRRLPGTRPITELGLSASATVGDLILQLVNGTASPTVPVTLSCPAAPVAVFGGGTHETVAG